MKYKFPSILHLPNSPGVHRDDSVMRQDQYERFLGKDVVVTEKMDGENTSMYSDHIHARSIDSRNHPSRDWVKAYWASLRYTIEPDWRICGENVYAEHSIKYGNLDTYFYGFSVWTPENWQLSFDAMEEYFAERGILTVPVIYRGQFDIDVIMKAFEKYSAEADDEVEGFVVRLNMAFPFDLFQDHMGKWVRPNHVQTDEFWMHKPVVPNKINKR